MSNRNYLCLKLFAIGLLSLFLLGCSGNQSKPTPKKRYQIEITERILVPGGFTRAYMQNGQQIRYNQINEYAANCNLEISTLADYDRFIEPGIFDVTDKTTSLDEVIKHTPTRPQFLNAAFNVFDNDSLSDIMRSFHFSLHSPSQPDVKRISCRGALASPNEAEYPTRKEMKQAVGTIIKIHQT